MSAGSHTTLGSAHHLHESDRSAALLSLVRRVAVEDRAAFAELHGALCGVLTAQLRSATADHGLADAIVAGTFVEVWWLSRYHTTPDTDVLGWVAAIAVRRTEEWARHRAPDRSTHHAWIAAGAESYYRQADVALAEFLDQPR